MIAYESWSIGTFWQVFFHRIFAAFLHYRSARVTTISPTSHLSQLHQRKHNEQILQSVDSSRIKRNARQSFCILSATSALIWEIRLSVVWRETGSAISRWSFVLFGSNTAPTSTIFFLINSPSEYSLLNVVNRAYLVMILTQLTCFFLIPN